MGSAAVRQWFSRTTAGIYLTFGLLLAGCATTETPSLEQNPEFSRMGILVTGGDQLRLTPETTFAWREPLRLIGADDAATVTRLMQTVEQTLVTNGFRIVKAGQADYLLSGAGVMGELPAGGQVTLDPGLQPAGESETKGSLLLAIREPAGPVVWRGSAQAFLAEGLSAEFREKRAHVAVARMLADVVPARPSAVECKAPRSTICTREYLPVCGKHADGSVKTYANRCEACADPSVVSHVEGACPE